MTVQTLWLRTMPEPMIEPASLGGLFVSGAPRDFARTVANYLETLATRIDRLERHTNVPRPWNAEGHDDLQSETPN